MITRMTSYVFQKTYLALFSPRSTGIRDKLLELTLNLFFLVNATNAEACCLNRPG